MTTPDLHAVDPGLADALALPSVDVVALADDVRVDRIGMSDRYPGEHLILMTDVAAGLVVAALRVTPAAAAVLVTMLTPIAVASPRVAASPRVSGALLSLVTDEARR